MGNLPRTAGTGNTTKATVKDNRREVIEQAALDAVYLVYYRDCFVDILNLKPG